MLGPSDFVAMTTRIPCCDDLTPKLAPVIHFKCVKSNIGEEIAPNTSKGHTQLHEICARRRYLSI
jgi:hypothetical protein